MRKYNLYKKSKKSMAIDFVGILTIVTITPTIRGFLLLKVNRLAKRYLKIPFISEKNEKSTNVFM